MPENYTITTFNYIEEIMDSIYAGNMITGGTMTITPDPGYVVSASDFSHDTLPEAIATCVFTDTGTAGQPGNTVLVTFTFGPLFLITSSLPPIYIHIIGDAQIFREDDRTIDFSIDFIDNTTKNPNGSSVVNDFGSAITKSGPVTVNGIETTTLSATGIASGTSGQIGTLVVTADSGFYFNNPPTITLENIPEGTVTLQLDTVSYRTDTTDVYIWNYKIMFISEIDISSLSGGKVHIGYRGVASRSTTKEILKVVYGDPEVSASGATRTIKIVGDVGAEFDLTVTKNSDNTSIMDVSITNADILHIPGGLIRGINKTLVANETNELIAEHIITQVYPASGSNEIYHINVTPKNGTILNSNLPQAAPQGIIYQYTNPTLTLVASRGSSPISTNTPTNIVYTGRPNSSPSRLKHIKSVPSMFQINYQLSHGSAISKGDNITWSSTGTSSWANSAYDSSATTPANHGNHIEIVNIVQTATGANTASLTADVIIKKFGTANVTMLITLDTFFTT